MLYAVALLITNYFSEEKRVEVLTAMYKVGLAADTLRSTDTSILLVLTLFNRLGRQFYHDSTIYSHCIVLFLAC